MSRADPVVLVLVLVLVATTPALAGAQIRCERPPFELWTPDGFHRVTGGGGILCRLEDGGNPPITVTIEGLGGLLERAPLDLETARRALGAVFPSPGTRVEIAPKRVEWRGVALDLIEFEVASGVAMHVCVVRLPLEREAIQVNVGGPAARAAAVRSTLDAVLAKLEGDVRWADEARRKQMIAVGAIAGGAALLLAGALAAARGRRRAGKEAASCTPRPTP